MKNHLFIFLILIFISKHIMGQKSMSRFEELKAWKLSYITNNTSMNSKELEVYKCIFEEYEKKGMQMKHERNEKLLKKIRPKVVLNILYQEKRFDRELFNRIKNKTKKYNKKDKK